MRQLVFASRNPHKVQEIAAKLGKSLKVIGLAEIGCHDEIEESADTLEGNARLKAWHVYNHCRQSCFADDTGLEVYALNNQPGVRSARYAGKQNNADENIRLLLQNMQHELDRRARFRTVICLIMDGVEYMFEGKAEGHITRERRGSQGFGYDSVFVPSGTSATFAQLSLDEKNIISHRGKAIALLKKFMEN